MSDSARTLPKKRCRICRREFEPRLSTQVCCSPNCAIAYARSQPKAVAKTAAKLVRQEKRERKEGSESLETVCAKAQKDVNAYVRARDRHKGCISCESGRVDDAGHFFPIGSKYRVNRLRFDTRAIHGQCRKCNSYVGGGNLHGYIAGLIRRYGQSYVDSLYEIKAEADQSVLDRLTKDEVKSIAKSHRVKRRELERERA